jgi:hypothetical protein
MHQHYCEQQELQEVVADPRVTKGRVSQLHALQRIREAVNVKPRIDRKVKGALYARAGEALRRIRSSTTIWMI